MSLGGVSGTKHVDCPLCDGKGTVDEATMELFRKSALREVYDAQYKKALVDWEYQYQRYRAALDEKARSGA